MTPETALKVGEWSKERQRLLDALKHKAIFAWKFHI